MHEYLDERYGEAEKTARISFGLNLLLGVAKAVIGVSGGSLALVADALHTLSDSLTSIAVWVGIRIASKPADQAHPYGHGKAEPIAGKVVAVVLVLAGVYIAVDGVRGLVLFFLGTADFSPPGILTLYAALLSIFVKEILYRYQIRVARKLDSVALSADAWHHRSDALSSVCVAIGIAAAAVGGPRWHWADEAAALLVAVFVVFVGVKIFRESAAGLMDTLAPGETIAEIRRAALSVEGVRGVEKTLARRSGFNILVDIHVEVDGLITVEKGHEIAGAVKHHLIETVPPVTHVLVHIEPYHEAAPT